MDGINFIQDLAVVLLSAGMAGIFCKRIGLSVIVGYLLAGMLIGPYTPPFSFITDVDRIQVLSQVGLVFLMFAIGLGLSLTRLGRMGLPTLLATALGAFFIMNLTQILGSLAGWSTLQSLFMASMFMVSSSAVIAKIIGELKLTHEGYAQRTLAITVMEDVVAVVMLTVLASQTQGAAGGGTSVGALLATMSAFVVLLVGAGLLLVPRLFRRLEARADPELQAIIVAGVLFLLALCAAKAGYSLALGAFLLGAIVAEMPQKTGIEKSFAGLRDIFSSVFFVSIGMMIEVRLLLEVWGWILGLSVFVMVARPLATGAAMILCGTPPREARRGSLLLSPVGEFSFIIAQLGVTAGVLPARFYPLAVGVSILTVLTTPFVNHHATHLIQIIDRLEPRWLTRALNAYHEWLKQIQNRQAAPMIWRFVRGRLLQALVEILFMTGLLIFSPQLLRGASSLFKTTEVEKTVMQYGFWAVLGLLLLVLLLSTWRNISTVAMIFAESVGAVGPLSARVVERGFRAVAAVILGAWLYLVLPIASLPGWGWLIIAAAATAVLWSFSNRLIYWYSTMESSVQNVFTPNTPAGARESARIALDHGLESWGLRLEDCTVPDAAACAGQNLAQLAIPARFGCSIIEVERNGCTITRTGPDLRLYPGDKVLLLGQTTSLAAARTFLLDETPPDPATTGNLSGSVLESQRLADGPRAHQTLAQLKIAQTTGVRIAGIQRGTERIINPDGHQILKPGDDLLIVGTLDELRVFRRWLKGDDAVAPATLTTPA